LILGQTRAGTQTGPVQAGAKRGCAVSGHIERIAFDWNRDAAPFKRVKSLDLFRDDQNHTLDGSPQVIPLDRDLL
jgi:hypothetical protein